MAMKYELLDRISGEEKFLWQYEYGQKMRLTGIDLPASYTVHFANSNRGQSWASIGDETGVAIPDMVLLSGKPVYFWLFLHVGDDDGQTVYGDIISVHTRTELPTTEPTPVQRDILDQLMAALENATEHVDEVAEGIPTVIDEKLEEAKESGEFDGPPGAVFTPSVTQEGVISWSNDGELPNPDPVDLGNHFVTGERFDAGLDTKLDKAQKGANNGIAELDEAGKVPASQLPSFVDDIVEYPSLSQFPSVGESGKIYVSISNNTAYRWTGLSYVPIGGSLVLGETSTTAYRGDRGKAAYDHALASGSRFECGLYKIETNAQGHIIYVEAVTKADIVNLGIPGSQPDVSTKADKTDTVLNSTLSMGRKANTNVGNRSTALGENVTASGSYSHAEGIGTTASGFNGSHAEGHNTKAIDDGAHAEGYGSTAGGDYSHAEGNNTLTEGAYSHAEGKQTEAHAQYSHAEGAYSSTTGTASHAEGNSTSAIGSYSHSEGSSATARGQSSHAEGSGSSADGVASHAEGGVTEAIGDNSHSEGSGSKAYGGSSHAEGGGTKALGYDSHAEGGGAIAYGSYSHAEGGGGKSIGNSSHAEGGGSMSVGNNSHAEGGGTMAIGICSHTDGMNTIANGAGSHVFGKNNVEDKGAEVPADWAPNTAYVAGDRIKVAKTYVGQPQAGNVTVTEYFVCNRDHTSADTFENDSGWTYDYLQYAEIVGNGADVNHRANARVLDWNGNERLKGDIYVKCNDDSSGGQKVLTDTDTVLQTTLSRGRIQNLTVGDGSYAFGNGVTASGDYSHAEGSGTNATGNNSHAEGGGSRAAGDYAHAEGAGTQATGQAAHSENGGTQATGDFSHAEGSGTSATNMGAHSEGGSTVASGSSSHAEGGGTNAVGDTSHAEGSGTYANGSCSHSEGMATVANGMASHVGGVFNVEDSFADWDEWVAGTSYAVGDKVKITTVENETTTVVGYRCKVANSDSTFTAANWEERPHMNFVEIIGNGDSNNSRSNARSLDWDGNEYLRGQLYVGCNPDGSGGTLVQALAVATDAEAAEVITQYPKTWEVSA